MDNFSSKPVTIEDINKLTEISIRAFHSDFKVGAPNKIGGPPGYDSLPPHLLDFQETKCYILIQNHHKKGRKLCLK